MNSNNKQPVIIGVDGGGTKVTAGIIEKHQDIFSLNKSFSNRHYLENPDFNFGFSNGGHGCARSGKGPRPLGISTHQKTIAAFGEKPGVGQNSHRPIHPRAIGKGRPPTRSGRRPA